MRNQTAERKRLLNTTVFLKFPSRHQKHPRKERERERNEWSFSLDVLLLFVDFQSIVSLFLFIHLWSSLNILSFISLINIFPSFLSFLAFYFLFLTLSFSFLLFFPFFFTFLSLYSFFLRLFSFFPSFYVIFPPDLSFLFLYFFYSLSFSFVFDPCLLFPSVFSFFYDYYYFPLSPCSVLISFFPCKKISVLKLLAPVELLNNKPCEGTWLLPAISKPVVENFGRLLHTRD